MSDLKQTIYLRQSSSFGPWVECEKSHPDAVAFDRRTQPEATATAQDLSAAIFRDIAELEYDGLEQEEDVIKVLPNDLHLILDRHLASSANALSGAIDKDAKIAAQRARIMELEEQLARALDTPVNDWCPECHARESSGDALSAGDRVDAERYRWYRSCGAERDQLAILDARGNIIPEELDAEIDARLAAILQSQKA